MPFHSLARQYQMDIVMDVQESAFRFVNLQELDGDFDAQEIFTRALEEMQHQVN